MNITKKQRDSNMELLRIVAMFLVLLVHADFFSLGEPSILDCANKPFDVILRVYFGAISISCVDTFVCLSGWFGIKPKLKSISAFIFQCLFWMILIYVIAMSLGLRPFSKDGVKECFVLSKWNWFIKAYLLLYIISPLLNSFVENAPRKTFKTVLIYFFVFEFVYGWLFSASTGFFQYGYSTISFVGLYLLARYFRIYRPEIACIRSKYLVSYLIFSPIVIVCLFITPPILGFKTTGLGMMWINYLSPYCISYAMTLIILFSRIKLQNQVVNWLGASSFAVYLIHANPNVLPLLKDFFLNLHISMSSVQYWIFTFISLSIIFLIAVLIDQARLIIWNKLSILKIYYKK